LLGLDRQELGVAAFIITRIQVGDYEMWKPMFDQDRPRAREDATSQRVFRSVDDPNHVFVFLEFSSLEEAREAQRRLLESGVLDRFTDKHGPNVVTEADAIA
jgi:histidinol-phosphate/aromatic aminotransferase/cobyric acid decarboxylase-like protein